jgi:hypothetical protein
VNHDDDEVVPVRPWEVCEVDDGKVLREIQLEIEPEAEEAREPRVPRDPGAPTATEVEQHNVTHLPFRAWCPACVMGKARDKMHRKQEDGAEKGIPEIVFDYGFLGAEGEETIAIQVARDRRTRMIFAHVVPKKGCTHEHGAQEMIKDIGKLGYQEVILKCDGEPALKSVQNEVKRIRADTTIVENSPVGDSRANGAAERAVQAIGEQVRVLRCGLEQRLGVKLSGKHPVMAWLVEHGADLLSRYVVGEDGRTGYERLKGKKCTTEAVEFGEKVHYKLNMKAKSKDDKMEAKWDEGFYLGRWWRTGEAIVGTPGGIRRAGTIRRVGGHRRWDRAGLEGVRGVPWQWDPEQGEVHAELKVRWLKEEEVADGRINVGMESKRLYRLRLKKEDFMNLGFTEGCRGCQALITGTAARGHSEACRDRIDKALEATDEGRKRKEMQFDKENELLAKKLEAERGVADEERRQKKAKLEEEKKGEEQTSSSSSGSGMQDSDMKRKSEDDPADWAGLVTKVQRRAEERRGQEKEPGDEEDMEVSIMERTFQEDMTWEVNEWSDMCEPEDVNYQRMETDLKYYDENTWEELDPVKVTAGERDELERFTKMGVYEYIGREQAMTDPEGKFVKVKWVRTNKGTAKDQEVRCRLVAQELGYGQRMDEMFAGTPSLMMVKVALVHAVQGGRQRGLMILDVKCAFLYGLMKRTVYIELPSQDPRYGDGEVVGVLRKAMYGTRDAPQIWQNEVKHSMEAIGFVMSSLQPSVYYHREKCMLVIVHVDDFLCSGEVMDLEWLYEALKRKYDLKKKILNPSERTEVKYLNRTVRWTSGGIEMEGDQKHGDILMKEWGMEQCKAVDTPITKGGQDGVYTGEELSEQEGKRARRAIARVNYMAQDRPDLSVVARVMSQCMSRPTEGVIPCIKRVIRYLKGCRGYALKIPYGQMLNKIEIWSDSDWAGDATTRKSCSGGFIKVGGTTVSHWSKTQSNVALSSGEAELNAAVKAVSEGIGVHELMNEILDKKMGMELFVDASACRGMVLRQGTGKVKHLTTKQLWVQGAVQSYGILVSKVDRTANAADALTHPLAEHLMSSALESMNFVQPRRPTP